MNSDALEHFFDAALRLGVYSNKHNLKRHLNYLFDDIELDCKSVLDVGGGAGLLTIYAAIRGAKAVCVEPEGDGSTGGVTGKFAQLKAAVDAHLSADLVVSSIQDYLTSAHDIDVVVIANAINHLNENACIHLLDDPQARDAYKAILQPLHRAMAPGGWLVITDCSPSNFFNDIGVKSPFMPDIEWHKHQSPRAWSSLLEEVGFAPARVQWSSPNTLGELGHALLGNRMAAYFLLSHFRLAARKLSHTIL
jgi:SAM-dependent methyltransferase